jgi:hypothetical protein
MKHRPSFISLLFVLSLAGCVQNDQPAAGNPYPPVPTLIPESQPKPPVTAEPLMWQPGHWDWNGSGYVWAKGQYVPAQGHGNKWMPGWWAPSNAGWTWQAAHWTS